MSHNRQAVVLNEVVEVVGGRRFRHEARCLMLSLARRAARIRATGSCSDISFETDSSCLFRKQVHEVPD